jgi:mono/diheme cytochrome c family protein
MPEGHPLRARAAALDARWAGRRPPGWGDELLAAGGDPRRGERIFRRHEAAQCLRCHAVRGSGAGMAGPALTAIATRRTIAELVEAVVEPGRTLVPGWGDVAAMPETTEVLTPAETRDVIAYLASLDDTRSLPPPAGQGRARRFVVGTGAHVLALGLAIAISVAAVRLGRGAA